MMREHRTDAADVVLRALVDARIAGRIAELERLVGAAHARDDRPAAERTGYRDDRDDSRAT